MPTFEFQQSRFTEGVLAKSLQGRSPEEFYSYGVDDCQNMIPLIEGPMVKRPGTIHVAESKTSSSILIPFYKGGTEAYVLEMGYDESATNTTFDCDFTSGSTTVTATSGNVALLSIGQHLWQSGGTATIATTTAYPSSDTSATIVSIDSATTFTITETGNAARTVACTFSNKPYIRIFSQDKQLGFGGDVATPYVIKSHRWFKTTHATDATLNVDEIANLSWTQSGDVLFFTCPTRKPFLLSRTIDSTASLVRAEDNTIWTMSDYVQEDGPYENTNANPDRAFVALTAQNSSIEVNDEVAFCQFDVVNNVIVLANHGMQVGQKINLFCETLASNTQIIIKDGTVDPGDNGDACLGGHIPSYHTGQPGTLVQNNYYYVVYATSVSFQISDSANGAAFDIGYINKDAASPTPTPGNQFTGEVKVNRRIYERDSTVTIDSRFRYGTNPDTWATTISAEEISVSCTTQGSTTVLVPGSTTGILVGQVVSGTGIPTGATVLSISANVSFVLSSAATTSTAVLLNFVGNGLGGKYFTVDDIGRLIRLNPIADTTTRRGGIRWAWGNIVSLVTESRVTIKLTTDLSVYSDAVNGSNEWRLGAFNGYWTYTNVVTKGNDAFTGNGYPNLSQIYQQRLCFASTELEPSTVWLSRSGNFYNFAPTELGVQDSPLVLTSGVTTEVISSSNGLYFTIDSDTLDEILWLQDSKRLALGTSAGVYFLYGSETNLTVTPQRFTINRETSYSATNVEPVVVSNVIIYPQRGGREIQELEFSGSEEQWLQTRISMKAYDIISTSSITKLVWQERPNPIIWMLMDNGKVLSLSYDRQVKFKAWSVHTLAGTDAKVTDIAIIPRSDYDQVWFQVNRTINGATKTYIERLNRFPSENVITRNELVFLDSAIIHKASEIVGGTPTVNGQKAIGVTTLVVQGATTAPPIGTTFLIGTDTTLYTTLTGSSVTSWNLDRGLVAIALDNAVIEVRLKILTIPHLEAQSAGLCTNGMEHASKTVASNVVTLDHSIATTAVSGLFYDASMTTLSPPTLENQYNWFKRLKTLTALIQDSLGIRIEYNDVTEELLFRSTQQNTGEPIPLFSGFRKQTLSGIGWDTHNVKIKSISPLPMQVNGLSIELETGGP
jgi:hypothetical protein